MLFDVRPTVNPLVYTVFISWREPLSGSIVLKVWNLMQKWLTKNDCIPNGSVDTKPLSILIHVIVKRRFGNPKDESP